MIFIILGTQKFQLNRLLAMIDELLDKKGIQDTVYAQIGNSDYEPKNYEYVRFMDKEQFEQKIKESDLIITHSGVGSIITAVNARKPVIVFPRLKKYKEHVDDHQVEIADAFEKKGYVLKYDENKKLEDLILQSKTYEFGEYVSGTDMFIKIIEEYLENNLC